MSNSITIKGMHSGIILSLKESANFDDIKKDTAEKFNTSSNFFGTADKAITFRGKSITDEQKEELIDTIHKNCKLHIVCIVEEDDAKEQVFKQALNASIHPTAASTVKPEKRIANTDQTVSSEPIIPQQTMQNIPTDSSTGQFFKGNLRSGQVLDVETSIIIIGDVNVGAKVISKGNVIILGSLKGNVYAGSTGNENAFVVALEMEPMQIRIADTIARSPDKKPRFRKKKNEPKETKIAFCDNNNIYIEPLDKNVMSDIHL